MVTNHLPRLFASPPLYELQQLAGMNAWFCSRSGRLCCVQDDVGVVWPNGSRILHCEQAPGGHRLLGVGHWDEVSRDEVERAPRLPSAQPVVWQPAPADVWNQSWYAIVNTQACRPGV